MIAVCCSLSTIAQAELLTDKNKVQVDDIYLEILLDRASVDAQKKLLSSKSQLREQLEQLYLRKILAEMAVKEGLDKQGINAERIAAIRENALYLLKLDDLSKDNTKDYSKYAKQIYLVTQDAYPVEARIDAAHILVSTKTLSDAEALEKAANIRRQLMLGANFSELALKESDDKSVKINLGQMGTFTRVQMVKPFSDKAFTMQEGELSEPVKTQYGFHIILLNKKFPAGVRPFDEVKAGIINKLRQKDWEIARTSFYQQVMKDNEMQIDQLAVDEFVKKKLIELNSQD